MRDLLALRLLVAGLVVGLLFVACGTPTPTPSLTPAPTADTDAIVNAYFRALETRDCATVRALSIGLPASCDWSSSYDGHSIAPFPSAIAPAATAVQYYVHATMTDPGIGEYRTGFFVSVALQPDGTWKVTSVGTGP